MRGHKEQKVLRTWRTKFFRAFQHKQYGLARILLASFLGLFVVTLAVAILFSSYTGRNYLRYNSVSAFLANPEPDAEFTVNMGRTSEPYPRPLIPGLGMPNSAWSGGSQGMGGSSMASSGPEAGTQTLGMDCYLYDDKNACYQLCKDPSTTQADKDLACSKYDELAGVPPNCGLDQGKLVCNGDCRDAVGGGRECWFDGQWAASLVVDSSDYQTNCLKSFSKEVCAGLETKCVNNKDTASCTLLSFYSCIGQGYTESQCEEMQKNPTLSNPDNAQASKVSEQQNIDCIGRLIDQKGYGEGCSSEPVTPRESPTTPSNPQPQQLPDEEKSILKSLMDSVQAGTAAVVEAAKKAVGTVAETVSSLFQGNEPKPIPITIPKTDPAPPKVSDEQRAEELLIQCRNANDTAACNQLCSEYSTSTACNNLVNEENNLLNKCESGLAADCQVYCTRYPNAPFCSDLYNLPVEKINLDSLPSISRGKELGESPGKIPIDQNKCSGLIGSIQCAAKGIFNDITQSNLGQKANQITEGVKAVNTSRAQNRCKETYGPQEVLCNYFTGNGVNDQAVGIMIVDKSLCDSTVRGLSSCQSFIDSCLDKANPNDCTLSKTGIVIDSQGKVVTTARFPK